MSNQILNQIYTSPSASHPHLNIFNLILNLGFLDSFFEDSSTKETQTFDQMEQFITDVGTVAFEMVAISSCVATDPTERSQTAQLEMSM